ncbi:protein FAR1-RELATED SEQUENCE 5-like [Salvia hispanica]|uniref:protein FAR1-RELATED SEQUENCE 5-like n=1 Tax=Salvia hispanica TaxID=49212 RepID=UPI002009279A|nr:protein FAR1-RELATED SEQUENCE 5-like [Salvia hispanica]
MTFTNEEEAYQAYNAYAFSKGFEIRKGKKFYNRKNELRGCTFLCCCEGYSEFAPSDDRKTERSLKRCGCVARIRFHIEGGVWEVVEFNDFHNHPFVEDNQKHLIRSCRKITETKGCILNTMVESGIKAIKAYSYLTNEAGGAQNVVFTLQDARNFLQSKRMNLISAGDCQSLLKHLQSLQASESNLFYSFQVDDQNRMTNFFWCDGASRIDYDCFGDVVVFDTTYRTNKYNMVCAPFVGVNNHWKNVLFGCAFMLDETITSFIWVFETFMEAMGGKAPKTIFTDQDSAMANAIGKVFPNSVHRLCVWHISKNATQHISHLLSDSRFKAKFNKIMYEVEMENEMEQLWRDLCEEWNVGENKWLCNLYSLRHKWCPAFNRASFSAGIRSTQRSESTNNVFKHLSCKTMTLTEFVNHYEKQAEKMRDNQVADDFECTRGVPRVSVDCGILRLFDLLGWLCFHALTVMNNHLNMTTIPMQYILKRWTKSARREFLHDDGGSCSFDLTMSKTYHLKELMRQSFDVMSLSVNDVETVKIAKRKLHELDVEIRNYASSVSKSENHTMRNQDNDVPQHASTQILDPLRRKSKGMTNTRLKSAIEKRKKGNSSKGKKHLPPFHGMTPIEQTPMLNTDFHVNPSHQTMGLSSNMMSIQHANAQPFSYTSLLTQGYQGVPSVPQIMFPSDCPP